MAEVRNAVKLKRESYWVMLACGYQQAKAKQAAAQGDPGGKNSGLGGVCLPGKVYARVLERRIQADSRTLDSGGPLLLRAVRSPYDRCRSLVRISGRFLRHSQGLEGVQFGNHGISFLLFADDVGLMLASSGQDLQHVLERFAAECEAAGMRISNLQIRGHGFSTGKEWRALSGWVERSCLKWRSSSISGSCSQVKGKMEHEIDRLIGAASAVMRSVYRTVVMKKELSRKAAKLSIYRSIYVPTLTYGHELW
ncbi:hypothetical protein L3Q82_014828, partial [Scortum barcoo]